MNGLNENEKPPTGKQPRFKNQVIDLMNQEKSDFVILQPGEEWVPKMPTQTQVDNGECKVHVWHKVTLFTTTVEECKKCGRLRD
jgi:hypothetical protein